MLEKSFLLSEDEAAGQVWMVLRQGVPVCGDGFDVFHSKVVLFVRT